MLSQRPAINLKSSKSDQFGFSILEVMVVAGLMSIVGLSITSVITNTSKSQKRIEQKDLQINTVNFVRGLLQNPNFCINAFCVGDVATCGNTNINFLPTGDTNVVAATGEDVVPKQIYSIQSKLATGTAATALRCSAATGCNTGTATSPPPTSAPFGTPVPGINGLYLYGMWLKDIYWKGNDGNDISTAKLVMQFATAVGGVAGPQLRQSEIDLYFKSNAGNITACQAGAVDSKWQDSPSVTNGIYYNRGPVGVGVLNPNRQLHVVGPQVNDGDSNTQFRIEDTAAFNASPQAGMHFATIYSSAGLTTGMGSIAVRKENATDGDYASAMTFHTRTNGSPVAERIRIDSSGNVGIGTTAPATRLHVVGNISGAGDLLLVGGNREVKTDNNSDLILTSQGSGTVSLRTGGASRLTVSSGGAVSTTGDVSIGRDLVVTRNITSGQTLTVSAGGANITGASVVTGTFLSTGLATFNSGINVPASGASITGATAVTGNFSVSGTSTLPTLSGAISHTGGFLTGGGAAQEVVNYGAYRTTSDRRYKENIRQLDSQLENIKKVKTYSYNYIEDKEHRNHMGVIAQDIREIFPDLVRADESGYLSVNYQELIPVLIKGLQESNQRLEKVEAELFELKKHLKTTQKK